jgi:hypothetical protein
MLTMTAKLANSTLLFERSLKYEHSEIGVSALSSTLLSMLVGKAGLSKNQYIKKIIAKVINGQTNPPISTRPIPISGPKHSPSPAQDSSSPTAYSII